MWSATGRTMQRATSRPATGCGAEPARKMSAQQTARTARRELQFLGFDLKSRLADRFQARLLAGEVHPPFVDLLAIDADCSRRFDSQANSVALNRDDADANIASDDDFLSETARKYKHGFPSWEARGTGLRPSWEFCLNPLVRCECTRVYESFWRCQERFTSARCLNATNP